MAFACLWPALASAPSGRPEINDYLNSLRDVQTPEASLTVINRGTPQANGYGDDRFTCQVDGVREQGSLQQLVAYGSRSDVVWPGSLIQGSSLMSNQLAPISLTHGPEEIQITAFVPGASTNAAGHMETIRAVIPRPTPGVVMDQIHNLVFPNPGAHQPANMSYTSELFYSANNGASTMSANFSSLGADVSTYLRNEDYDRRSHLLVQFVQQYYSVAVTAPAALSDFFDPRVKLVDLKAQTSQANGPNPAVYINTITYGRVAYIFLSSSEAGTKLKASADAAFNGLVTSGRLSGTTEQQQTVLRSTAQVFVLGGDATAGSQLVTRKLDALNDWITRGGTFSKDSPGAAIAFSTRYLRSDFRIAGAAFITDYSKPMCFSTPERLVAIHRDYAIDDDKDKGNAVRFLVYKGNVLLAQERWGGDDLVYRTSPPNYTGPILALNPSVPISDCSSLRLRTEQNGHDGKTTGKTWVYGVTDAGRTITLVDGESFSLDDTASKDYTTSCRIPPPGA